MPRDRRPKSTRSAAAISQAELAAYRTLAADVKIKTADQELRRRSIVERLEKGAKVQRGKLAASLEPYEVQYFTPEAAARVVSSSVVAAIKAQIPPILQMRLAVVELPT
jgi:hypothetical protein